MSGAYLPRTAAVRRNLAKVRAMSPSMRAPSARVRFVGRGPWYVIGPTRTLRVSTRAEADRLVAAEALAFRLVEGVHVGRRTWRVIFHDVGDAARMLDRARLPRELRARLLVAACLALGFYRAPRDPVASRACVRAVLALSRRLARHVPARWCRSRKPGCISCAACRLRLPQVHPTPTSALTASYSSRTPSRSTTARNVGAVIARNGGRIEGPRKSRRYARRAPSTSPRS